MTLFSRWHASGVFATAGMFAMAHGAAADSGTIDLGTLNAGGTTYSLGTTGYSVSFQSLTAGTVASRGCYIDNNKNGNACTNISIDWTTTGGRDGGLKLDFYNTKPAGALNIPYGLIAGQKTATDVHLYFNFTVNIPTAAVNITDASLSYDANTYGYPTTDVPTTANTYVKEWLCANSNPACQGGTGTLYGPITASSFSAPTTGGSGGNTYNIWTSQGGTLTQALAGSVTSLNVSKELAALADASNNNSGFNLGRMTQLFQVPEPVSVGMFGAGVAGAMVARRWRRKTNKAPANDPGRLAA